MHFQRTATLITFLVTLVAAQNNPTVPDLPNQACNDCVNGNMVRVANCRDIVGKNPIPLASINQINAAQKQCLCSLEADMSWLTSCQTPSACTASFIQLTQSALAQVKGTACDGFSVSSAKSAGSLSASCGKTGAAVLVMAAAAAHALL